jgi:hypothetical protein
MIVRSFRRLCERAELGLWALLGPVAGLGCIPVMKYGPGPTPTYDCEGFTGQISMFTATPVATVAGGNVTVSVAVTVPDTETVQRVELVSPGPVATTLDDDGRDPDAVAGDGTSTGSVTLPAGAHDLQARVTLRANEETNTLCEREAATTVVVEK